MTALDAGELAGVERLLAESGAAVSGPLSATLIAGGRSNLTYRLEDGMSRWVLRTPPRVGRTPSAHDMGREYRVTTALAGTDVPVPPAVLFCEDESVLGGPFAVAEFVEGRALRSRDDLAALDDGTVNDLSQRLVETLVALHRVDHIAVGLERFGRPDAYSERQLRRWSGQWDLVGTAEHNSHAEHLRSRLLADVPAQERAAIVHGDFRADNTLVGVEDGVRVNAVVDWELSTIGDPVADVAMMCAYRHPAFDLVVGTASAWTSPRLPDSNGLAAIYEAAGGQPLDHWDFHLALAYFKIAVIAAGIDHRHRAGSGGGEFDSAGQSVAPFLEAGLQALSRRV